VSGSPNRAESLAGSSHGFRFSFLYAKGEQKMMLSSRDYRFTQNFLFLVLFAFTVPSLLAAVDSVNTKQRTVTKIADGVYAIRHPDAPDGFPQGNTTVIIGENAVFVVDSTYWPVAAREDIAQIRQWTNKPVRYLLNTHWHFDHTMGNATYADAFPGIAIVAHTETRKQIAGYNPGWFERYPQRADRFREMIATGKAQDGRALTDVEKKDLQDSLPGFEPVGLEYQKIGKRLPDLVPNLAFDHEMDVDLGNREVRIMHLGRGNTLGDAVVYLPKERIAAAGDLLDYPVPYLGGGYPVEEVGTLENLARLDIDTIVPGHGSVLHDKAYLNQVIEFLKVVVAEVDKQVFIIGNGSRNLEKVKQAVLANLDVKGWRERFSGSDKDNADFFDTFALPGAITAACAETLGR
jgi:glyoxylase-like metal-dependent hydrolase (beta-lactamase superfamily II)